MFDAQKEYDSYLALMPKTQEGQMHTKSLNCLLECVKWVLDITECQIFETQFTEQASGTNI